MARTTGIYQQMELREKFRRLEEQLKKGKALDEARRPAPESQAGGEAPAQNQQPPSDKGAKQG
jgi:hypothetical protein